MVIKKIFFIAFILVIGHLSLNADNYPQKSIDGKGFYLYKVNSAEGFYSICKKFVLLRWNTSLYPSAKNGLKNGQDCWFQIKGVTSATPKTETKSFVHTVSAGETLYAIARMYHVSPDSDNSAKSKFWKKNTSRRKFEYSSNKPEQTDWSFFGKYEKQYIFHTITAKETLFSVARKYGTTVESLLKQNPGLSPSNFSIGKVIRITPIQQSETVQPVNTPKTFLYTVKKKETLYSIAQQFGITIDDIKICNPGIGNISKNDIINIPIKETDSKSPTPIEHENISQIYNEIHSGEKKEIVNVAVLLPFMLSQKEDTKSALYLEYYQGFLLAVEQPEKTRSIYRRIRFWYRRKRLDSWQDFSQTRNEIHGLS